MEAKVTGALLDPFIEDMVRGDAAGLSGFCAPLVCNGVANRYPVNVSVCEQCANGRAISRILYIV
jgi:hypothetical protein